MWGVGRRAPSRRTVAAIWRASRARVSDCTSSPAWSISLENFAQSIRYFMHSSQSFPINSAFHWALESAGTVSTDFLHLLFFLKGTVGRDILPSSHPLYSFETVCTFPKDGCGNAERVACPGERLHEQPCLCSKREFKFPRRKSGLLKSSR